MENATKALLIAAAVLVAIIIISITLIVVRQGQEATGKADLSEVQIEAHNSKFKSYEGKISIDELYQLMRVAILHNQQEKNGNYVDIYYLYTPPSTGVKTQWHAISKDSAEIATINPTTKKKTKYVMVTLEYQKGIITKIYFETKYS